MNEVSEGSEVSDVSEVSEISEVTDASEDSDVSEVSEVIENSDAFTDPFADDPEIEILSEVSEIALDPPALPEPHEQHDATWYAARGVHDARVVEVLNQVARRTFMATGDDPDQPLSAATTLPPLEVVGKLIAALKLTPDAKVLEIGTDTGYIAALLSRLASFVYSVERRLPLAKLAEGRLKRLGIANVDILHGPRLTEYALNSPYDAILLSAIAPRVPEKLKGRLAIGGRMVVPVAEGDKNPEILCIERTGPDTYDQQSLGQLRFSSKLGDILVELGVADRSDIELAALEADARGQRLGQALVESARIQERDLIKALAIQRGFLLAPVDTLLKIADHELVYSVPRAFLRHHQVIPLLVYQGRLTVATVDPDAPTIELARILDATQIETYLVSHEEFDHLWNTLLEGRRPGDAHEDNLKTRVEQKFENVLRAAHRVSASTIHIDNQPDGASVRLRMASGLTEVAELAFDAPEITYLVEFLKMSAHLDPLEQVIPQRGRLSWVRDARTYHLHIHVMPSILGEQLSIKLLSRGEEPAGLEELGFDAEVVGELDAVLQGPPGLFLIVGPRHEQKSQTFYALLKRLGADRRLKVASLEDDILATIPGVQQALIQPERGFGFDAAISEFVRFDVDVLGIGDFPDPQTVMQALNLARRGVRVIGVLHGKSALHVLQGLREFGVPVEALAHGLSAILTQRSAARICDNCREPFTAPVAFTQKLFPQGAPMGFKTYRGAGCPACAGDGTRGRTPVVELMPLTDQLRAALAADEPSSGLRQAAEASGITPLSERAIDLARQGVIPPEELVNFLN